MKQSDPVKPFHFGDFNHPDSVILNNRIAYELELVKLHIETVAGARALETYDRLHADNAALRSDVTRLTVMVDVLFRALASKGAIDLPRARAMMEEELHHLAPPPKPAAPAPVAAPPTFDPTDPFAPIVRAEK